MDVLSIHHGIRYGVGGATIVAAALFMVQLFWDRRNLVGFVLCRQYYVATHRVFRVCGFLLSVAHLAALCDSYGVFGLYSAVTRVAFRVFMMVIIVPPLCAYFYFSIKPLHPFLFGNENRATRRLRRFLAFVGFLGAAMLTAIQVLTDPLILTILISAMMLFTIALLFITAATFVTLQKLLKTQENKAADIFKVVRSWNRSAAATTLLLSGALAIFVLMLAANIPILGDAALPLEEAEFVAPNDIRLRSVVNTFVFFGFSYLLLWRSWRSKDRLEAEYVGMNKSLRAIRVSYQCSNSQSGARCTGERRTSVSHHMKQRRGSAASSVYGAGSRRGSAASTAFSSSRRGSTSYTASVHPKAAAVAYKTHTAAGAGVGARGYHAHRRSSVPVAVLAQGIGQKGQKCANHQRPRRRFSVSAESAGIPLSPTLFSVPSDNSKSASHTMSSLYDSNNSSLASRHRRSSLSTPLGLPVAPSQGQMAAPHGHGHRRVSSGGAGAYGLKLTPPNSNSKSRSLATRRGSTGGAHLHHHASASSAQALSHPSNSAMSDVTGVHASAGSRLGRPHPHRLPTLGERLTMERHGHVAMTAAANDGESSAQAHWHGGRTHQSSMMHLLNMSPSNAPMRRSPSSAPTRGSPSNVPMRGSPSNAPISSDMSGLAPGVSRARGHSSASTSVDMSVASVESGSACYLSPSSSSHMKNPTDRAADVNDLDSFRLQSSTSSNLRQPPPSPSISSAHVPIPVSSTSNFDKPPHHRNEPNGIPTSSPGLSASAAPSIHAPRPSPSLHGIRSISSSGSNSSRLQRIIAAGSRRRKSRSGLRFSPNNQLVDRDPPHPLDSSSGRPPSGRASPVTDSVYSSRRNSMDSIELLSTSQPNSLKSPSGSPSPNSSLSSASTSSSKGRLRSIAQRLRKHEKHDSTSSWDSDVILFV